MTRIGLDLDNTIIDYEALIREELALDDALRALPAGDKRALRDALRAQAGGELRWTNLQARIYGPRLAMAMPFEGAQKFVAMANEARIELVIVSHKTRYAAADTANYDIQEAARNWLSRRGFVGTGAIPEANVFFEETREKKVARIATLKVDAFLDDLSEVFAEPAFPGSVERWLFSPTSQADPGNVDRIFASWASVAEHVFRRH